MSNIVVKDANFTYPNLDFSTISSFSMDIKKGENIMILGDNGSGKSTLGKLLCGLTKPTEGFVKINSLEVSKQKTKNRVKLAYYITQINQLQFIKASLGEEIKITEAISKNSFNKKVYERFQLPQELDFNPFELSVNEGWRFSLFLSTIINPKVLFIDELPSSVNSNNIKALKYLMQNRKENELITFLSYQRNINFPFDKLYSLENSILAIQKNDAENPRQ